jgi:hypothetical protein
MKYNRNNIVFYICFPALLLTLVSISYLSQGAVWKDNALYMILARRISSGQGFSDPVPYLLAAPLYPIASGLLSKYIFGNVLISGRIISSFLWFTTGILIYKYLRREHTRRLSTLGAILWASITFPAAASLLTEPLYTFLIFSAFLSALSIVKRGNRIFPWLLFSFFSALAYLTRPEGVWFYCLAFTFTIIILLKTSFDRKKLLLFAIGSLAVFAIITSPYIVHVHDLTGKWKISGKQSHFSNKLGIKSSLHSAGIKGGLAHPNFNKGYALYHLAEIEDHGGPDHDDPATNVVSGTDLFFNPRIIIDISWGVIKILGHFLRKFSIAGFGLLIIYLLRMPGHNREKKPVDRSSLYLELAFLSTLLPVALFQPKFRIIYPYLTIVTVFIMRGFYMIRSPQWKRFLWVFLAIHCIYLTTHEVVAIKHNSRRNLENIAMAAWINSHFPAVSESRMLSYHPGVPYYAGIDYYRMVYLDSIQELEEFMVKYGYKYLLLNVEDIGKYFPPYKELLDPDGDHGNFRFLHREKSSEELLFFELVQL